MENYMKVEGISGLYRDPHSKAIVNMDQSGYEAYIAQKNANAARRKEQQQMQEELDNIKSDVNEIKNMLLELLQKNK